MSLANQFMMVGAFPWKLIYHPYWTL